MKRTIIFQLVITFTTLCCLTSTNLNAQIFVTPMNDQPATDATGFYYALPQNVIKLDVIIQKTEKMKGPYSEFSEKVLGVSSVIDQDEMHLQIIDIVMSYETEPDPKAWFFVEFDERGSKDARSLVFDLQANGILLAADEAPQSRVSGKNRTETTLVNSSDEKQFRYFAERNLYQRVDTIVRKITIDTTVIRRNILQSAWVDRNPEQKARSAADMIHKIRESRYNLISGFQEIDYGKSIAYMDEQLQALEEEYLSLFLGKEVKSLSTQTLYYVPDPETNGKVTIAGFSETAGLLDGNAKATAIEMEITSNGTQNFLKSNVVKGKLTNSVYYRIPGNVTITLTYGSKVYAKERKNISQLGTIAVAPVSKTRLQFDPESGMITTVKRE